MLSIHEIHFLFLPVFDRQNVVKNRIDCGWKVVETASDVKQLLIDHSIDFIWSKLPFVIVIHHVEKPLGMEGCPTDEKGQNYSSWKIQKCLNIFFEGLPNQNLIKLYFEFLRQNRTILLNISPEKYQNIEFLCQKSRFSSKIGLKKIKMGSKNQIHYATVIQIIEFWQNFTLNFCAKIERYCWISHPKNVSKIV